jgi:phosphatidylserine synthase 2
MLQFKDGLFYRPHPAFWRIIKGCAVLYLVAAVFFLFLVRIWGEKHGI